MSKDTIISKYTCFICGEGKSDENFLTDLFDLKKFKFHTKKWEFQFDHGKGCCPNDVLEMCKKSIKSKSYDLVLCFIDIDKLKHDFKNWEEEKEKLEKKFIRIKIIWQIENLEDEIARALSCRRNEIKKGYCNRKELEKIVNSDYWKKIIDLLKKKEKELENNNK